MITITPTPAAVNHCFNIPFASSPPGSLVISLNHIQTTRANSNTIIANQRYLLMSWIYPIIRSGLDSTCVGQFNIISLFPSADGNVSLIAQTDGINNDKIFAYIFDDWIWCK
jgi:hypothetical protein